MQLLNYHAEASHAVLGYNGERPAMLIVLADPRVMTVERRHKGLPGDADQGKNGIGISGMATANG
jgi:hypothetical protein